MGKQSLFGSKVKRKTGIYMIPSFFVSKPDVSVLENALGR